MGKWANSLTKLKDYYSKNGKRLPIDLDSSDLFENIESAIEHIYSDTGIAPESNFKTMEDKVEFYKSLIGFTKNFESHERRSNYGSKGDEILKKEGDLGEVLHQKAGVCRELTCFGHLVSSIYGIDTTIAKGYSNNQNSSGRRHVWLKDNESSLIVDLNKHKRVFNEKDYDHYQISEQTLVKKSNENP